MLSRLLLGFLSLIALASGSVLLVIPRPVLYGAGQALPTAHLGAVLRESAWRRIALTHDAADASSQGATER